MTALSPADQAARDLAELASRDPVAAPLARLYAVALRAADEPAWAGGVPPLDSAAPSRGTPMLHGIVLRADPERLRQLLAQLADLLMTPTAQAVRAALHQAAFDPLELVWAAIAQRSERIEQLAARLGLDATLLGVLGQLAALPLLLAGGRGLEAAIDSRTWQAGYCPCCAAWPTLQELRGLDREAWLCCGRCGTHWRWVHQRCVFCGTTEQSKLSYLAAESERESRRAITCEACHGYFKAQATFGPLAPGEVLLNDLATLELDLAAVEAGFARPATAGFELGVRVEAADRDRQEANS